MSIMPRTMIERMNKYKLSTKSLTRLKKKMAKIMSGSLAQLMHIKAL